MKEEEATAAAAATEYNEGLFGLEADNSLKEKTTTEALQPVIIRKNRLPAIPKHTSLMNSVAEAKLCIEKCSVAPKRLLEKYAKAWLEPEIAKEILASIEQDSSGIASYIITLAAVDIFSAEDGSGPSHSDFNEDRLHQVMPIFEAFNTIFWSMEPENIRKQLFEIPLKKSLAADRLYVFLQKTCSLLGEPGFFGPTAFLCLLDNCYDVRVAKKRYTFTDTEVKSKKPRRKCPITGRVFRAGDTALELYFLFRINPTVFHTDPSGFGTVIKDEETETFARKVWISDAFMPGWMCCLPKQQEKEDEIKLNLIHAARRAKTDNLTVVDAVACMIDMPRIPEWLARRLKPFMAKFKATASGLLKNEEQYRKAACEEVKKNKSAAGKLGLVVSEETLTLALKKRKASKIDEKYYQMQWVCFSEKGIGTIVELIYEIKQLQVMFLAISSSAIRRAQREKRVREEATLKRKKTIQEKRERQEKTVAVAAKKDWAKRKKKRASKKQKII